MSFILGIETSCDETAAAVFDTQKQKIISSDLFSQIKSHEMFGGVVPEIASRSQLEKIDVIVRQALNNAHLNINDIDVIAVTNKPGLAGSLIIGVCFAKSLAFAKNKKLIGINHLEGHIFSSFLCEDGSINRDLKFPFLCLSVSGGHTVLYLVKDFGEYEVLGQTVDDAAGEAFDKTARLLGLCYPGGPLLEKIALEVGNVDFFKYPRQKFAEDNLNFSFSGLKTAVLYDLINRKLFDQHIGKVTSNMNHELQCKVASSLQICIAEIFEDRIRRALKKYPEVKGAAFVGGVAANSFIKKRLSELCARRNKIFVAPPKKFCTDNGAMIAFVGSYKASKGQFSDFNMDVFK